MNRARSAWAALCLMAVMPAAAETGSPALEPGPLPVRDHFLLGSGFLAFEPTSADVLAAGEWRLDAVWTVANSWAVSPQVDLALRARARQPVTLEQLERLALLSSDGGSIFVDGELSRVVVAIRRGIGSRFQLDLRVPLLSFGGGVLDGPIESFHDSLGVGVDGRNGALHDEFLVASITRRGRFFAERPPSSGLGDVTVSGKFRLFGARDSRHRAAVEALVKLPTASNEPFASSGETDFGAQLLLARVLRRWSFHGSAGIVSLGASPALGLDSQRLTSVMAAAERTVGSRTSLLVQASLSESPFGSLATSRIGKDAFHATLGLKRALRARNVLFVALTENLQNFTNSADLDLHLGISRKLGIAGRSGAARSR